MAAQNFLYYNTPPEKFEKFYIYPWNPPFKSEIYTQLPKNIAIIRSIAVLVFSSLAAFSLGFSVLSCSIVLAGAAFAGWTIYSHIYAKDQLMEAFRRIVGSKEAMEKLPLEVKLKMGPNEKISDAIARLKWDELSHKISLNKIDGRNVIIIKALSREVDKNTNTQTKAILAFVEKLGPYDVPKAILPDFLASIQHAIAIPFKGNTFGTYLYSSSCGTKSSYCEVYSSISKNLANELIAQLS